MPRWTDFENDWDGDDDVDEVDESGDDSEETVPCPYCRRQIHDDSVQCPHCGSYLSDEDVPPQRKPWWIVLGAALCLLVIYFWFTAGF